MAGPLKDEVQTRFPWLQEDLGFRITRYDYSPRAFGNSTVELQSGSLRIRFTRERGISVQVASLAEPEQWMELGFLWYSLTGTQPEPELDGWGWFLRDHLPQLVDALGPGYPQTKQAFAQAEQKSREILAHQIEQIKRSRQMTWTGPFRWSIAGALILTAAALLLWSLSR